MPFQLLILYPVSVLRVRRVQEVTKTFAAPDYSSLSGKEYKPKSKSLPGAKIKSLESLRPIFADRLRFDVDVHSTNDRQS
jgi:hypothetical protein